MDFEVLKQRLDEQRTISSFYYYGVEMLVKGMNARLYFETDDLKRRFPDMPTDFLDQVAQGEMPSEDDINAIEVEELDNFVQHSISLIGLGLGIHSLLNDYPRHGKSEYVNFIHQCATEPKMMTAVQMFGTATLAYGSPISFSMLSRLCPITDDEQINVTTLEILCEMVTDMVNRYVNEAHPEMSNSFQPDKSRLPSFET